MSVRMSMPSRLGYRQCRSFQAMSFRISSPGGEATRTRMPPCCRMRSRAVAPTISQRSTIPAAESRNVVVTSASERRMATLEKSNEVGIPDLFGALERAGVSGGDEIGVDEQRGDDVRTRPG